MPDTVYHPRTVEEQEPTVQMSGQFENAFAYTYSYFAPLAAAASRRVGA